MGLRRTRGVSVCSVLMAHELWPTVNTAGITLWSCKSKGCGHAVDSRLQRHSLAQAEHQAERIAAMIRDAQS